MFSKFNNDVQRVTGVLVFSMLPLAAQLLMPLDYKTSLSIHV